MNFDATYIAILVRNNIGEWAFFHRSVCITQKILFVVMNAIHTMTGIKPYVAPNGNILSTNIPLKSFA